jgi:cytochrome c biogenesis protein CcmG, thiol:disulfide interchange protein DsbE
VILRVAQVLAVGLVVALLGLLIWRVARHDSGATLVSEIAAGKHPAAPEFRLRPIWPSAMGATRRLSAAVARGEVTAADLGGRATIVNVFASWCGPCKDEAPLLQELSVQYRDRGVVVLGIDSQDATSDGRSFANRYGLTYPLLHTAGSDLSHRWGVTGYPETFLIDREGHVVHHFPGAVTGSDVKSQLDPLLGSKATA